MQIVGDSNNQYMSMEYQVTVTKREKICSIKDDEGALSGGIAAMSLPTLPENNLNQ